MLLSSSDSPPTITARQGSRSMTFLKRRTSSETSPASNKASKGYSFQFGFRSQVKPQEKDLICPYQYLYYSMLLEYTSEDSFRLIQN